MKSVLVTGASQGLGLALARLYAARGWRVFPLVRSPQPAESWATSQGAEVHPICADVGEAGVESAIAAVLGAHLDALDLLVNNAGGIKKLRWLAATTPDDLEELFRVHCVGAFRCTRAALPFLRKAPRACVVNITSRFGSVSRAASGGFRGIYSYSIAKGAQNMLTACLDDELRREGIRVLAVHPGKLRTRAAASDADTDPELAALTLADWLESVDRNAVCALHDLMADSVIPW